MSDLRITERIVNEVKARAAAAMEHIADDQLVDFADALKHDKPLDPYCLNITVDEVLRALAYPTVLAEFLRRLEVAELESGSPDAT